MYVANEDKYCYAGTSILKNKQGFRNKIALEKFEVAMVSLRMEQEFPTGKLNARHYLRIHKHLFQDVYSFAGKIRNIRISKDGNVFCYPENIKSELNKLFDTIQNGRKFLECGDEEFVTISAAFLAELNAIHPFREGNGRTQLAFFAMLSAYVGKPINLELLREVEFLEAMILSFSGNCEKLEKEIELLLLT